MHGGVQFNSSATSGSRLIRSRLPFRFWNGSDFTMASTSAEKRVAVGLRGLHDLVEGTLIVIL